MSLVRIAAAEDAGSRADVFVSLYFDVTRTAAARLLAEGAVTVNGAPAAKNTRIAAGDEVGITLPPVRETATLPEDIPIEIVFEDDDLAVVNKPKGMVVHPAAGNESGTLVNALLYRMGDRLSGIGGERRPGIVHRIDKDTSGLLVVAKNDFAHTVLSDSLKEHGIDRVQGGLGRQPEGRAGHSRPPHRQKPARPQEDGGRPGRQTGGHALHRRRAV